MTDRQTTDRPTNQATNQQTNKKVHREVIHFKKYDDWHSKTGILTVKLYDELDKHKYMYILDREMWGDNLEHV